MMQDSFGRLIDYLRVSVTDRCNLRCRYCMPSSGITPIPHKDILSYEEIVSFVRSGVEMGLHKVRLTGGEPLVRKGIVSLVHMLAEIDGIVDLSMSTNGTLLTDYAKELRAAGLHRVNISVDTLSRERYAYLTRGGNVQDVLSGIETAKNAGLEPIKLNCVVEESSNDSDAMVVAAFAMEHGLGLRFIRRMDIATGKFHEIQGGDGGRCQDCNRLRLSSDGWLRPCLFSDVRVNVRDCPAREAISRAVHSKPERGSYSASAQMHAIGG